jgi:hypothetical protein
MVFSIKGKIMLITQRFSKGTNRIITIKTSMNPPIIGVENPYVSKSKAPTMDAGKQTKPFKQFRSPYVFDLCSSDTELARYVL